MRKKHIEQIFGVLMVLLAVVIAAIFYLKFDLEGIFLGGKEQVVVTSKQIKKAKGKKDFTGKEAGKGIRELKTKASWKKLERGKEYATIKPGYMLETGVYGLGRWSDYYHQKEDATKKKKKSKNELAEEEEQEKKTEAIKPVVDYSTWYSPFYILALPDGVKILAQMDRSVAKNVFQKFKKGEEVYLPIGKKISVSEDAKELLKEQCKVEGVSLKSAFYAIDDEWQTKNADAIFWGKIGITIFVFILATILLQLFKKAYLTEMFHQIIQERRKERGEKKEERKMKLEKEKEEQAFQGRTIEEMFSEEEKEN